MIGWDPTKLIGQGSKTKNQPEEYELFFSCPAKEILKKGQHILERSERNKISEKAIKEWGQPEHPIGFQTIAAFYLGRSPCTN
jgi:hypothetical protein